MALHMTPQRGPRGRHRSGGRNDGVPTAATAQLRNAGRPAEQPVLSALPTVLAASDFRQTAAGSVTTLAAGVPTTSWLVSRVVEDTFTVLETSAAQAQAWIGQPVPFSDSICYDTLRDRSDAVSIDLTTTSSPTLLAKAGTWHAKHYLGAPLRDARGGLLGTVCGYDQQAAASTMDGWLRALDAQAASLSRALVADLQRAATDRATDLDVARRSTDSTTGLPDRNGWGLLLAREEERAARLAEQVGVVLVDLGSVFSTRGARRAAHAVLEAAGDRAQVARTGPRQLGLLVGGRGATAVAAVAGDAGAVLRAAGVRATTGWAMRSRTDGMIQAWWEAEDALLTSRAALAVPGAR